MRQGIWLVALELLVASAAAVPCAHAARLADVGALSFWSPARVAEALAGDDPTAALGGRADRSLAVVEPAAPGNRTDGRILGYDPRTGPYSCSGTSLMTPSGSIVLTAGHCLYEDGSWGRDLVFIPALEGTHRPFGTFVADAGWVMADWRARENWDFDLGALRVAPGPTGTLAATVGARPWTSGRSRYGAFQIFGYPAGGLDGEELRSCQGTGIGSDPDALPGGPSTVAVECAMGSGSSGGAWLRGEAIDGVTSYGYGVEPGRLYSPYFGPAVASFLSALP